MHGINLEVKLVGFPFERDGKGPRAAHETATNNSDFHGDISSFRTKLNSEKLANPWYLNYKIASH
jgi:hypothetical protein